MRKLGIVWGILFLLGGILGFVPGITEHEMFLGIFMVNTAHGLMHIVSGAVFLAASSLGTTAARLWFLIFGAFYAVLAVIGFQVGEGMIFRLISNNTYDSWGHAGLALVLLLIGLVATKQER